MTADGGVAGHLRDEVEVHGDHGGVETHARAGARGFASRMARADDEHVVLVGHCYYCSRMRILIVGSGGREHALAWRLAQTAEVFAIPGNPGMAEVGTCLPAGDALAAAEAVGADLTVIGPEAPLVEGIADRFRAVARRVVGPVAANARRRRRWRGCAGSWSRNAGFQVIGVGVC